VGQSVIPSNAFTAAAITGGFLPPNDLPYTPLRQVVWGGQTIGDGTKGRLVKYWEIYLDTSGIIIRPVNGAVAFTLTDVDVSQVTSVSLAFENNMGPVIAYTVPTGANLYYFDSQIGQYVTRFFPGVDSCRVCVDDARDFYLSSSDVIFSYTQNGNLAYRKQRDRYSIESIVGQTNKLLIRVGQTVKNRLQFELGTDFISPPPSPLSVPRFVTVEGILFVLSTIPVLQSIEGQSVSLNAPQLQSLVGNTYDISQPFLTSFDGADIVVNRPVFVSLEGNLVIGSPTFVSFEGSTDNLVSDPNFKMMSLGLHFDGIDGSTIFEDTSFSPKVVTARNGAVLSKANSKFGGVSLFLSKDINSSVIVPSSEDFNFRTGDFWIDAFISPTILRGFDTIISRQTTVTAIQIRVGQNAQNLEFLIGNQQTTGLVSVKGGTLLINEMQHIAVGRRGTTLYAFVGGELVGTGTSAVDINETVPLVIGGLEELGTVSQNFSGYIDDLRVYKGVALHVANFATPKSRFSDRQEYNFLAEPTIESIEGVVAPSKSFRFFRLTATKYKYNGVDGIAPGTDVRITDFKIESITVGDPAISFLTGKSTPFPFVANASSEASTTFEVYRAFDGQLSDASRWISSTSGGEQWIQLDIGSRRYLKPHRFLIAPDGAVNIGGGYSIVDFKIEGSLTGQFAGEQVNILTRSNIQSGWVPDQYREFLV